MEDEIEQTPTINSQDTSEKETAPLSGEHDTERQEDIALAAGKALDIMGIEDPSNEVAELMGIDPAEQDGIKNAEISKLEELTALEREIVEQLDINAYQTTHEQLNELYMGRIDDIAEAFGAEGVEVVAGRLTSRQAGKYFTALLEKGAKPSTLLRKLNTLDVGLHAAELLDAGANANAVVDRMEPDDIVDQYDNLVKAGATKEAMKAQIISIVGEDSHFVSDLERKAA